MQSMNSENYRTPKSIHSVDYADYYECRNSKEYKNLNLGIDDVLFIVGEGRNKVFTNCTFSNGQVGDLQCTGGISYSQQDEKFIPKNQTNITFHYNNMTMKNVMQVFSREQGKSYQNCFDECASQDWCKLLISSADNVTGQTFCQLMDIDYDQFIALSETHLDGALIENFNLTEIKGVYDETHVRDLLDIKAQKFRGYRGFIIRALDNITSLTDVW